MRLEKISSWFGMVLLLIFMAVGFVKTSMPQTETSITDNVADVMPVSDYELRELQTAVSNFVQLFQLKLDFGSAFDRSASKTSLPAIKASGFFEGMGVKGDFINNIDNKTLLSFYKAEMNLHLLRLTHELYFGSKKRDVEIYSFIDRSKFRSLLSNGWTGQQYRISDHDDLRNYLLALESLASLYRTRLPKNVFQTKKYLSAASKLSKSRNFKPGFRKGWPEAGIERDVNVYAVERDIFVLTFIREKSTFKVLFLTPEA